MRHLLLIPLTLTASLALPAEARRLQSAGSDVCAVRPDLCDDSAASTTTATRARPRRARATGLDAQSISFSSIVRQPTAKRAPAAARAAIIGGTSIRVRPIADTRSLTCRPATVEATAANADLAVCGTTGRSIASVETASTPMAAANFNSYMNQNATNPALSRRIANYQTAFKDTAKPATLDLGVSGSGVRETAANVGGSTAAATPNNQ